MQLELTPAQIQKKRLLLQLKLKEAEEAELEAKVIVERCIADNKIAHFAPFEHQQKALAMIHVGKKTVMLQGANQIGKTILGTNLAGSFSLGFQPWDNAETIFGRRPVSGRIICNDWEKAAKETIVPKLKEWLPKGSYETKKNNVGVEAEWIFPKTGSKFSLLTYKEDTKSHEGWTGDWVWFDEPPPRDKYTANRRGLVARDGIVFISMTALDEPWLLDEIALKNDTSIGVVADVPIQANTTLSDSAIKTFKDSLPDNEVIARIQGGWLQLVGRIWKGFDKDKHVCDSFKVPPDWPVWFQIDFHLNIPHAVLFMAMDKYGRHFLVDEIWENCSSEELADEIIRRKERNGWRLKDGEIDALSKGDAAYTRNRFGTSESSFDVISKKLTKYGIRLGVGSKDEKSYIRNVETWLKGPNGEPLLKVFRTCEETIKQIDRWTYDKEGKPKDDGHFPECLGRFSMMGCRYTDPALAKKPLQLAKMGV